MSVRKNKHLLDIKEKIEKINEFLGDKTYKQADEKTKAAVNMYMQVIGENVRKLNSMGNSRSKGSASSGVDTIDAYNPDFLIIFLRFSR